MSRTTPQPFASCAAWLVASMPEEGLEPSLVLPNRILNPARLPIPPLRREWNRHSVGTNGSAVAGRGAAKPDGIHPLGGIKSPAVLWYAAVVLRASKIRHEPVARKRSPLFER